MIACVRCMVGIQEGFDIAAFGAREKIFNSDLA